MRRFCVMGARARTIKTRSTPLSVLGEGLCGDATCTGKRPATRRASDSGRGARRFRPRRQASGAWETLKGGDGRTRARSLIGCGGCRAVRTVTARTAVPGAFRVAGFSHSFTHRRRACRAGTHGGHTGSFPEGEATWRQADTVPAGRAAIWRSWQKELGHRAEGVQ